MRFLWPDLLWLLLFIPVLAADYLHALRRRKKTAIRYASLRLIRDALTPGQGIRRHIPPALFLLAMTALIFAIARPTAVVLLPSESLTLVLAIDVSRSMRAEDVAPNRLSAAQTAAKSFIEELPRNIRVGIVSFAGTAAAVQTPTENKDDLIAAIDRFTLQRGTATGNGIMLSLAMLFPDDGIDLPAAIYDGDFSPRGSRAVPIDRARKADKAGKRDFKPVAPGSYTSAAIIMLSDGRRTTGLDPLAAARMAADRGVRIYTVGFGSREGARLHFEGWSFYAIPDEETLKAVAQMTGAEYFHASNADDLRKIYHNLSAQFTLERRETEVGALLSAAAALLVLGAALLSLLWFHRRT